MNLEDLSKNHNLTICGVINVGAYLAKEYETFKKMNIRNIIFIEANPNIIENLKNNVGPECLIYNHLIYDKDDVELDFKISNHLQSSSILDFARHKLYHPDYSEVTSVIKLKTKTLDTVVEESNMSLIDYNILMMDVQGAENFVLDGFKKNIKFMDYIFTEVNFEQMYSNCIMFGQLNVVLRDLGFKLLEHFDTGKGWGDALYARIK